MAKGMSLDCRTGLLSEVDVDDNHGPTKPYVWNWTMVSKSEPFTCSQCGDLTTVLYARNPAGIPDDEKRVVQGGIYKRVNGVDELIEATGPAHYSDKIGACLSCIPPEQVADNPYWYED